MAEFLRFFRAPEQEILVNLAMIWKIEVSYLGVEGEVFYTTPRSLALADPNAVRQYKVFVGSEVILVPANPDNPVMKVLEDIYKNASK